MKKSTNSQSRSYFLFSFNSVKDAIKVKQELNRRKDLLGDKRAEVTVLLEEASIMKNKDLSHTEKLFQVDSAQERNRRTQQPYYGMDPNMKPGMMPMGYPPMYPNMPNPYMNPYYHHPYMYEHPQQQPYFKP